MTPERWQELKELVASALAMPEAEREAFVRGRAAEDPELCGQAISLLASADLAESFLSAPALDLAGSILDSVVEGPRPPIARGARFGPYEILTLVGAGGMGEVYRARDERLKREVAVKVLPPLFTRNPDRLRRFEQEARAAGALNHPNILAIHDVGSQEGTPYVVSELLEGETLRQRLQSGALPARKAIDYAVQVARGLAAAHEKGIVHRDLKPENLFVTKDGRVKILDFGLAKITRPDMSSLRASAIPTTPAGTEPGVVMGTVGYMSPEQVRGEPTDARSDIFSLGAILYEMLSGRRAFRGDSAAETMAAILKEEPAELSATGKNVAPGLERIVRHCLEKSREERFHSARDLAFDLETLSGLSGSSTAVGTARRRWLKRPSSLLLVAGAVALIGAAALSGYRVHRPGPATVPSLRRLTFRRGRVTNARFAPDGRTVVYSAAWESSPPEIFTVRTDSMESRPLGLTNAHVLSVSSKGELAILRRGEGQAGSIFPYFESGTLARVPIGGGTPRELAENVSGADWSPDGEQLAITRMLPGWKIRLEYPMGRSIYEGSIRHFRVSPKGNLVALSERNPENGEVVLSTVDRGGKRTVVSTGWKYVSNLGWSPAGDEIIIRGGHSEEEHAIAGISLSGRERILMNLTDLDVTDVSPEGRLLVLERLWRPGMIASVRGSARERELAWLDQSMIGAIADDGSVVLFGEWSRDPLPKGGIYLRKTDGSPAVRLGDGWPAHLSDDGRWVLAVNGVLALNETAALTLLPTGAGAAKKLPTDGLEPLGGWILPKGRGVVFRAERGGVQDLYAMGPEGGNPKPLHAEGVLGGAWVVSPDGERVIFASKGRQLKIVSLAGGPTQPVPGLPLAERSELLAWSADGRSVYELRQIGAAPALVDRLDLSTGRLELWRTLIPEDPSGVIFTNQVVISRDGQSYAYSYDRILSADLYTVEGLH